MTLKLKGYDMKIKLNANEKHVVNVLLFLISLYGLIITLINYLITATNVTALASIGFIVFSLIVLYLGRDVVFGVILVKVVPATKAKRGITDGHWNIQISYKDEDKLNTRNGSLKFANSMVGVKIHGSQLIDSETKNIEKGKWFADDAELISFSDKQVLVYLYKIPKDKDSTQFEKAGIVVAFKNSGDAGFKGIFKDISFVDNKIQREGEVILFKTDQ